MNGKKYVDDVCDASTSISDVQKECCSFENLYKAMQKCKRNVMWKDSTAGFVKNGLKNCLKLHNELMNGKYKLAPYSIFIVREKKERVIVSTRMRDRVVQRSICDNYFYHELTKGFIYDNCACLIGKGTDFARNRLKAHLQRFYRKHQLDGYVLKVDIHDYFGSTLHQVAKNAVEKRISDEWCKQMIFDVIDSFKHISDDVGMGLGSQITQLVELAVLDDLDHKIKEELKIKYYVRYMDDFVIIHDSKEHLEFCKAVIIDELGKLGLTINEKKTGIQPINHGIKFLGFKFRLSETGKVIMKILPNSASKEKKKYRKLLDKVGKDKAMESYISWRTFADKGDNYCLLKRVDASIAEWSDYE